MRFRLALTIFGLYLLAMVLSGCETMKGIVKGGAEGLSKDWQNAKKADDWVRKNFW